MYRTTPITAIFRITAKTVVKGNTSIGITGIGDPTEAAKISGIQDIVLHTCHFGRYMRPPVNKTHANGLKLSRIPAKMART